MAGLFQKALARGLTFPNLVSWLMQNWHKNAAKISGTIKLRVKAALLGIQVGAHVSCNGKILLLRWPGGKININNNVSLISDPACATASAPAFPVRLRVFGPGAEIRIGSNSQLTAVSITARSKIIAIGRNVMIGPNTIITDSDFHAHWPCEKRGIEPGYDLDAPVTIDDYAWIGMNCIILKGVHIGRGAIIGAGSIVNRDVPDYCVACGNPAVIKACHAPV